MKVYIYCTKAKPYLWWQLYYTDRHEEICQSNLTLTQIGITEDDVLNGKIVASFELNEIEKIIEQHWINQNTYTYHIKYHRGNDELLRNSCLTLKELNDYLGMNNGYAWHIENLEIIEPLELGEFNLKKAPQSYRYAYYKGERCIILSVKAEWVEKILNGKKTIMVRKTAPKEML